MKPPPRVRSNQFGRSEAARRPTSRRGRAIGVLAVFLGLCAAGRGELELRGLCVTGDVVQLSFSDSESRQSFGWQRIGEWVGDYHLTGYDRKSETATLTKGAATLRLHLLSGVLLKSRAEEPNWVRGTMAVKGRHGRVVTLAADLKFGEDTRIDLGADRTLVITPSMLPDGNFLYLISFVDRSGGGAGQPASEPSVITRPYDSFGLGVDGDEISFTLARP